MIKNNFENLNENNNQNKKLLIDNNYFILFIHSINKKDEISVLIRYIIELPKKQRSVYINNFSKRLRKKNIDEKFILALKFLKNDNIAKKLKKYIKG